MKDWALQSTKLLHLAGHKASIVLVGQSDRLSAKARQQYLIAQNYGVAISAYQPGCLSGDCLSGAAAITIVDALFGVGLARPIAGSVAQAIAEARALTGAGAKVLAVDIPSGVCADTGAVLGDALQAHATVTFAFNKVGLTQEPGATLAGHLTIADIGIYYAK
jgi:NAD(P)H-hydrate epimerase